MIFVTVGTHEQPFNRLIKEIDNLKATGVIQEDVIIQSGYSDYEPKACEFSRFFSYGEMQELIARAHIVITHGAPATFLPVMQHGKTPIVVPRQKAFGEHINNHQLDFCEAVSEQQTPILIIKDIADLQKTMAAYDELAEKMGNLTLTSNNAAFNEKLEALVKELIQ